MTRTITLVKNANLSNLTGRHAQLAAQIRSRMIDGPVEVAKLKTACRSMKPKRFRAVVRDLIAARVVSVRKAS